MYTIIHYSVSLQMDEKIFNILCDKDKKSALLLALISSEDRLLNDLLKQVCVYIVKCVSPGKCLIKLCSCSFAGNY